MSSQPHRLAIAVLLAVALVANVALFAHIDSHRSERFSASARHDTADLIALGSATDATSTCVYSLHWELGQWAPGSTVTMHASPDYNQREVQRMYAYGYAEHIDVVVDPGVWVKEDVSEFVITRGGGGPCSPWAIAASDSDTGVARDLVYTDWCEDADDDKCRLLIDTSLLSEEALAVIEP